MYNFTFMNYTKVKFQKTLLPKIGNMSAPLGIFKF